MTTVPTAGDEERLVLSRCPFCGATPHRGPTKAQHDQLHGEPFQRYAIWCPHGCARIERMDERQAAADWNNRPEASASNAEAERLRDALRPFADFIGDDTRLPPDMPLTQGSSMARRQVTVADFRAAARALQGSAKQ